MQEWIVHEGLRVVVIFEGRDTAGQGRHDQADHRAAQRPALPGGRPRHPHRARAERSGTSSATSRTFPAAGEIVLFDRSWYNRAGVERVMGFCTEEEHAEFFRTCPQLERALVRSGHHPREVLAVAERRGAGTPLHRADQQPGQAVEAQPDGPRGPRPLGRLRRGEGRDVLLHRHQGGAVARRRRQRQEGGPAQHHQPPPRARPLRGGPPRGVELPPRQQRSYKRPPIDSQTWVPTRYVVE